jgi:hypothetical protein
MSQEKPVNSDLQSALKPFLKSLGLNLPAILDGLTVLQTYAERLALTLAPLAQIDWAATKRRLDEVEELPTKSKKAMDLASSKGWFFGWHESSLQELMALVEKLEGIEEPCIDEFMRQYYRDNLQLLTDKLVERRPNRASVIKAAVRAHGTLGTDGYFLSIPVFIAQADGLLAEIASEITGKKSATINTSSRALTEKLGKDQESLDLIHPIPIMSKLDFMKSACEREKAAQASGESFTALNRHQVMHGESWDYGTEINSLKTFSFLAFVGLHLPMILEFEETMPDAERARRAGCS